MSAVASPEAIKTFMLRSSTPGTSYQFAAILLPLISSTLSFNRKRYSCFRPTLLKVLTVLLQSHAVPRGYAESAAR